MELANQSPRSAAHWTPIVDDPATRLPSPSRPTFDGYMQMLRERSATDWRTLPDEVTIVPAPSASQTVTSPPTDNADHLSKAVEHLSLALHHFAGAIGSGLRRCCCSYAPSPSRVPKENDTGIILPTHPFKEKWDLLIMMLIIYSSVAVPVRFCFDAKADGLAWDFEVFVSLAFLTDLFLNFRTAFDEDGRWILDRARIAQHYLSGWFWIDAPSSIPVELVELALEQGDGSSPLAVLRVLRLFRLIRLLRLLKLDAYIAKLEENFNVNLRVVQLISLVLKVFFVAHLLGSFFFLASRLDEENSWLAMYDDGSAVNGPVSRQYLFSIYWALTTLTTVGYGDLVPETDIERWFTILGLLLSGLVFAVVLGEVAALLSQLDRQRALVSEKMDAVKDYVQWRNLPRDLSTRVRRYYAKCVPRAARADFCASQRRDGLKCSLRFRMHVRRL